MKRYLDYTDDQLVKSYMEGETCAFETLIMRHKDRVFSYIYNIVKDSDIADDIFQEVFIKVITTLRQRRYQDVGKFLSWVLRISHNLVIDYYRKQATSKTISSEAYDGVDLFNNINLCDNSQSEYENFEETLLGVENLIEMLPEDQKRVVKMRYYGDKSFKEIADIENVSINTALGRMRYALINMRKSAVEINFKNECV